jgi:hypothetical protein
LADEAAIRRKYRLPAGRPLIMLATSPSFFPRVNHRPIMAGLEARFRGAWPLSPRAAVGVVASWRYPTLIAYRSYLEALRTFADRHGALIVAKTRFKHGDPAYLSRYVDVVIGDESFFPFTTLELLRVSALYVGFYSATAIEAVAMDRYAVSIRFLPREHAEPSPSHQEWLTAFHHGPDALWNTRGVSQTIDGTLRSTRAWLKRFAASDWSAFAIDEPERHLLLERLLGGLGESTERLLRALEERVCPAASLAPPSLTASNGP